MKSNWKKLLPLLGVLLVSSVSFAGGVGLDVEPYVGYQFLGNVGTSAQFKAPNTNATFSSLGLGLRANVKFLDMFFAGPDFSWYQGLSANQPDYTASNGSALSNMKVTNGNQTKLGLVAGVQLPMSFRVWVGYNFLDNMSSTVDGAVLGTTFSGKNALTGSSFKIGAGYNFWSMLNVNAEYFFQSYAASTFNANVVGMGNVPISVAAQTSNQLLLTVSAPLNLM